MHLYVEAVLPVPRTLRTTYRPLPRVCGRIGAVVNVARSSLSCRRSSSSSRCCSPASSPPSICMTVLPVLVRSVGVENGQGYLLVVLEHGCFTPKLLRQNAAGRRKPDAVAQ